MKWLMWLALVGLVLSALYVRRSPRKVNGPEQGGHVDDGGVEFMTPCAHCGVYVPSSEALEYAGSSYCCLDHLGKPPLR